MAGPYLSFSGESRLAVKGAWGANVGWREAAWFPGTHLWLCGNPPLLAGFQGPD